MFGGSKWLGDPNRPRRPPTLAEAARFRQWMQGHPRDGLRAAAHELDRRKPEPAQGDRAARHGGDLVASNGKRHVAYAEARSGAFVGCARVSARIAEANRRCMVLGPACWPRRGTGPSSKRIGRIGIERAVDASTAGRTPGRGSRLVEGASSRWRRAAVHAVAGEGGLRRPVGLCHRSTKRAPEVSRGGIGGDQQPPPEPARSAEVGRVA